MSIAHDGWPAFPVISDEFGHFSGMDLRDYFATHATEQDIAWAQDTLPNSWPRPNARYAFADAMLATRAHGEGSR